MTSEEKLEVIKRYCNTTVCSACPLDSYIGSCPSDDGADIATHYAIITGNHLREEILQAAKEAVCGLRHDDYGSVEDNFKLIGDLWSTYLGHEIKPVDVAMCMALLKIARIKTGKGTRDSFVDLAGYAACGAEVVAHE